MSQLEKCQTLLQGPCEGNSMSVSIEDNLLTYFFVDYIIECLQKCPPCKGSELRDKNSNPDNICSVYTIQIYRKVEIAEEA